MPVSRSRRAISELASSSVKSPNDSETKMLKNGELSICSSALMAISGRWLAVSSGLGELRLWDLREKTPTPRLLRTSEPDDTRRLRNTGTVDLVVVDAGGRKLAGVGRDGRGLSQVDHTVVVEVQEDRRAVNARLADAPNAVAVDVLPLVALDGP